MISKSLKVIHMSNLILTSISPPVTEFRRLLTIILYSKDGLSVFFSLLRAAIGRFFRIEGGLGGLFCPTGEDCLEKKNTKFKKVYSIFT